MSNVTLLSIKIKIWHTKQGKMFKLKELALITCIFKAQGV